jgi:hypothetical protein
MLLNFRGDPHVASGRISLDDDAVINRGQMLLLKLAVHHRPNNLNYSTHVTHWLPPILFAHASDE